MTIDPAEVPTGASAMFAADGASHALGIEALDLEAGRARLRMTVTTRMVNGHGIAHGGYVFLLADSAFACACNREGSVTVAASADIDFIAPVRLGDVLVAEAVERVRRGRSGIYDVTVHRDGEGVAVPRAQPHIYRPADRRTGRSAVARHPGPS
jgi:acyl-CoA thioesterase